MLFAALALGVVLCIQVQGQSLQKLWEVTGLENPESVLYDSKQNIYYVSNVAGVPTDKDGNGFIAKVNGEGKVIDKQWVTGLNAPKGMGMHNGKLYVADIDEVAVIDIASGNMENKLLAAGATFLNDIVVSKSGDVYISDTFGGNAIYRIQNNKIERWLKDDKLDSPNGLALKGNDLIVSSWGKVTNPETFETAVKGKLIKVSISSKAISPISSSFANGDGLAVYKNGYVVSDWVAGKVFFVDQKGTPKELGAYNPGTADLTFIAAKNLLVIPQMMEGKLLAFTVK